MRSLSEVIFLVTDQGVVSYVSPSIVHMIGYGPEDVEGRQITDLGFLDGGRNRTPGELPELMSSLQGEGSVFSVRAKDGSVKRILIQSTVAMHGNDRLLIAAAKDVTHLLGTEEELKVRERLLLVTLDQMPIAAGILDVQTGRLIHANAAAARLLGHERDEMVGRTPAELGLLGDNHRRSFLTALAPGKMVDRQKVDLRAPDGSCRAFTASLMKIAIDEGEFMFFMLHRRVSEEIPARAQMSSETDSGG
jgi:PAS domain S-box-containing protein